MADEVNWLQAAITIGGMGAVAISFGWAVRADTKVLAAKLGMMSARQERMDLTLDQLAKSTSRMDVFDERMLSQGKRLDQLSTYTNDFVTKVYQERHAELQERLTRAESSLNGLRRDLKQ